MFLESRFGALDMSPHQRLPSLKPRGPFTLPHTPCTQAPRQGADVTSSTPHPPSSLQGLHSTSRTRPSKATAPQLPEGHVLSVSAANAIFTVCSLPVSESFYFRYRAIYFQVLRGS